MLIKVTNKCSAGCSHCMEDSTPAGRAMSSDVFDQALDFTVRMEEPAWKTGCLPMVLLSGGECTEHPNIVEYIERTYKRGFLPTLITNGAWLRNKELRKAILRPEWNTLTVQVTHDPRFYPSEPPLRVDDPRIIYIDTLSLLVPLGRIKNRMPTSPRSRQAPTSYNMRSLIKHNQSFEKAVIALRIRANFGGAGGHCSPSISSDGEVMVGETRNCYVVGTVLSSNEELTQATLNMSCNRCGLENNLTPAQLKAIHPTAPEAGIEPA